jgi:hypothetical protein
MEVWGHMSHQVGTSDLQEEAFVSKSYSLFVNLVAFESS